jgi:hypothetical protein
VEKVSRAWLLLITIKAISSVGDIFCRGGKKASSGVTFSSIIRFALCIKSLVL